MRSIRKLVYAAALGLSLVAVQPTLAAAEEARGSFTLSHEVRCEKIVLRPGRLHPLRESHGFGRIPHVSKP
jgi:hypothetical protein